ncbi:carbon-nitrogen hydrolase family protein [Falsiroseomonas oryziterrae]|uniref:carbon-nitrogen hydrolase family protein n=1 Tax=Falsiroseomonas oryziterrae TaxID=2911368 RepID=UPI001F44EDC5|nr:carbon-nitrogen hydrolase family protein [Roseomonas sp. NPKOSM-4]
MPRLLTVGLAQTGPVEEEGFALGLRRAEAMFEQAASRGVRLLVFSELFLAPFFPNRLEKDFDRWFVAPDGPEMAHLRGLAARHGIAAVLGVGERAGSGWFNAAVVVDERGEVAGSYRKTHIPAYFPTDAPGGTGSFEKLYFAPGNALPVFDVAGCRFGIQICNDRLYPEPSRVLALAGAEAIVMPICFSTYADPGRRASIWEVPLRARAYENGVWVLAANRVGVEGPRHHLGRSMVVDPRGMIAAEAGTQGEELLVYEIDLDEVTRARKDFPWWRDRRPDLYGPVAT